MLNPFSLLIALLIGLCRRRKSGVRGRGVPVWDESTGRIVIERRR